MEYFLRKNALLALVLLITTVGNSVVKAQIPSSGCSTSLLFDLSPCMNFFNASNGINPPQGCCTAFASVLETSATCICQLFSFMGSIPSPFPLPSGFPINQTQVLNLPGICKIATPQCTASGDVAPTTSPVVSGTTTATDGPSTLTSEAPDTNFPSTPSAVGIAPSSPAPTSEARSLLTPSIFSVCWGVILGSFLW